ncbi:MAG: hypothetical protein V2J12_05695 [Gammaproteobacteria bacterium]|jgi:hypothetical protein|nr:hypothetical protein [Gammaproteobacteria bacterium]
MTTSLSALFFGPGSRLALLLALLPLAGGCQPTTTDTDTMQFKRIPLQFIAALGEPDATAGSGAQNWGVWPVDPGPRGVRLSRFEQLQSAGNVAPAGWPFDPQDWWLEENGLIMESPEFPLAPGQYVVTGDREVTTVLTVFPPDANGDMRWELADGATLFDVTHLGCRSARYTPLPGALEAGKACTPASAPRDAFRVAPGAAMPPVNGCAKQDYAVLFLTAVAVD